MSDSTQMPDLSQMLSRVMANPEAMAMLSSLLGKTVQKEHKREEECCPCLDKEKGKHEEIAPLPIPSCPSECKGDRRRNLLLALKPYLSAERCQTIDRILLITEALSVINPERRH